MRKLILWQGEIILEEREIRDRQQWTSLQSPSSTDIIDVNSERNLVPDDVIGSSSKRTTRERERRRGCSRGNYGERGRASWSRRHIIRTANNLLNYSSTRSLPPLSWDYGGGEHLLSTHKRRRRKGRGD